MADNSESSSFGNFSIEDTMEMGMGNTELIDSFLSSDSVTSRSEEIKEIKDEPKKPVVKAETNPPKLKTEEEKKNEEVEDPNKGLDDLFDSEEDEEEKEEKESTEKKDLKEDEEVDESKDDNTFTTLSKELFRLGVFSKDEEEGDVEISTPEQFLERFNQEKKKGALEVVDKFIGQFGEDYQNAFQSIFVKGVNPKEYYSAYNNINDYSSLDLTIESNQVAVIKQTLLDQGYEAEDITAEIERLKNYGDLDTVAHRYHKVLVKKEANKIAELEKESEQRLQQQAAIKNQYIKNVQTILEDKLKNKEFDGIPVNPKLATELQEFLLVDKYKTPSGETLTEFDKIILDLKRPENHERKVKVALLLKVLEKDPTLSTIQKAGVTKKTDAIFGELARQTKKTGVRREREKEEKTSKPSSWFTS